MSISDEIKKRSSIDLQYDSIKEKTKEIINAETPERAGSRRAFPGRVSIAFSGVVLVLILVGGIFLFTNGLKAKGKNVPMKPVESDDPANYPFGAFLFGGKIYALQSEDQKKFVEEHTDGSEVSVKEIAKYLGIIEEEQPYTIDDIYRVLSKLDKNADEGEILAALDSVAGACDVQGGSGVLHTWYHTPDGFNIMVQFSSVTLSRGETESRNIFILGMGFKAEGWSKEEFLDYLKGQGIIE